MEQNNFLKTASDSNSISVIGDAVQTFLFIFSNFPLEIRITNIPESVQRRRTFLTKFPAIWVFFQILLGKGKLRWKYSRTCCCIRP